MATAALDSRGLLMTPTDLDFDPAHVVAKGSMGVIFKGSLNRSGSARRPVAVKRLLPQEQLQGFKVGQMMQDAIRSMHIGANLDTHPNVLEFIGACDTSAAAGPTLVYEFIDGIDVDKYFQVYALRDVEHMLRRMHAPKIKFDGSSKLISVTANWLVRVNQ